MSFYEDLVNLRVEAIITETKLRLWLQLKGSGAVAPDVFM